MQQAPIVLAQSEIHVRVLRSVDGEIVHVGFMCLSFSLNKTCGAIISDSDKNIGRGQMLHADLNVIVEMCVAVPQLFHGLSHLFGIRDRFFSNQIPSLALPGTGGQHGPVFT